MNGKTTIFTREAIERDLAHKLKDQVKATYQRGHLLE
jgi:hypothetical protein